MCTDLAISSGPTRSQMGTATNRHPTPTNGKGIITEVFAHRKTLSKTRWWPYRLSEVYTYPDAHYSAYFAVLVLICGRNGLTTTIWCQQRALTKSFQGDSIELCIDSQKPVPQASNKSCFLNVRLNVNDQSSIGTPQPLPFASHHPSEF